MKINIHNYIKQDYCHEYQHRRVREVDSIEAISRHHIVAALVARFLWLAKTSFPKKQI